MNYIKENDLGGQLKPIHSNYELSKAVLGRKNCYLYTVGTFKVNEQNLYELKTRNIKLIGLAFAQLKYKPKKEKLLGKTTTNIVVDELVSLDIKISNDINVERTKRYLDGGMH